MSVRGNVHWTRRRDGSCWVEVVSLELMLRDFAAQLRDEDDDAGAEAVLRVAAVASAIGAGEEHLIT